MIIIRKAYQDILETLKKDCGIELRFTTRIVFVNNLKSYIKLVNDLSDMADLVIKISDDKYCSGVDSIPDMGKVSSCISKERGKNIVVTSVGEYLRFARKYEANVKRLHSLMTLPVHSTKRVWIPIYAAKDIFQEAVGELSDERYEFYELEEEADYFECFVYSDNFSGKNEIVKMQGLKKMYHAWDTLNISSGISFSTKKISMIEESAGNYMIHVIKSPFEYIKKHLKTTNVKFGEDLGSDEFWKRLVSYAMDFDGTLEDLLRRALNIVSFDAQQVISGWSHLSSNNGFGKWVLWLWYKLDLAAPGDYLGFAIRQASTYNDIQHEIECSIFDCISNPNFDIWVAEREKALRSIGVVELCDEFWDLLKDISDRRISIKLLSNTTLRERTKIIEIISEALRDGKRLSDCKSILSEKYPELLLYLAEPKGCSGELAEYLQMYKQFKIMDYYDISISESAADVDVFQFDSRSKILNSIKCAKDAYFLWIDGMGIEWIIQPSFEKHSL